MEFISNTCRSCGGKLSILKDADECICLNCGTEYAVTFSENTISLKILSETLTGIQQSSDKTASELALKRIREERKALYIESYIEEIMISFNIRNSDKYNLDVEDLGFRVGLQDFGPSTRIGEILKLRTYCERAIQCEKQRLFPDKSWVTNFENYIKRIDLLIPKFRILMEQEEYHKKVVES